MRIVVCSLGSRRASGQLFEATLRRREGRAESWDGIPPDDSALLDELTG